MATDATLQSWETNINDEITVGSAPALLAGFPAVATLVDGYGGVVTIYSDGSVTYTYDNNSYDSAPAGGIKVDDETTIPESHITSLLGKWIPLYQSTETGYLLFEDGEIAYANNTLEAGNYYLAEDTTTESTITISGEVNLNLNGHVIDAQKTSSTSVITVSSGATLNLYDGAIDDTNKVYGFWGTDGNYYLTNEFYDYTETGGGYYYYIIVDERYYDFNSYDTYNGGLITGGSTTDGGGVYVSGTFNMYGGTIAGNTASSYGGGVYSVGTFNMSGGTISANKSSNNGAGVFTSGTFTMTGGTITKNTNTAYGGGVYVNNGTFEMSGTAEISSNETGTGGGVCVFTDGEFKMTGGAISGNTATSSGGGVYTYGTFTMSGGTITDNSATNDYGSGVCMTSSSTFIMSGTAEISSNTAVRGGGVYMYGGTFNVSGSPVISDNMLGTWSTGGTFTKTSDSNVYLKGTNKITISDGDELTDGASIGVTMATAGAFVSGAAADYSDYFFADNSLYFVVASANEEDSIKFDYSLAENKVEASLDDEFGGVVDIYTDGSATYTYEATIYKTTSDLSGYTAADGEPTEAHITALLREWKVLSSGGTLEDCNYYLAEDITTTSTITINGEVNLNLNGHTIDANGGSFSVIKVSSGTLNLYGNGETVGYGYWDDTEYVIIDEIPSGQTTYDTLTGGIITGANASNGGGVYVDGGIFNMYGGSIAGNISGNGGGVYSVYHSTEYYSFSMYGGVIAGNYTAGNGGGIYTREGSTSGDGYKAFAMYGGEISSNIAKYTGGGIYYMSGSADMIITDGTISGNTASYGGGIRAENGCIFTMTGGEIFGNAATGTGTGGGISVAAGCDFTMTGGKIYNNTATANGGGVFVAADTAFTITGGEIYDNTAEYGGGVYVYGSSTFNVSGTPVISGNTESTNNTINNVYLRSGATITIEEAISQGASIGVTMADGTGDFTGEYSFDGSADYSAYFTSDSMNYRAVATESDQKYTLSLAYAPTVDTLSEVIYANGDAILIAYGETTGNSYIYFGYDGDDDGEYTDTANYQYYFADTTDDSTVDFVRVEAGTDATAITAYDLSDYTIYGGASGNFTGDTRVTITGGTIDSAFGGSTGTTDGTTNLDIDLSATLTFSGVLGSGTVGEGITSFDVSKESSGNYYIKYTGTEKATIAYFNYNVSPTTSTIQGDGSIDYSVITVAGVAPVEADEDIEKVDEVNGYLVYAIKLSKATVTLGKTSDTYSGSSIALPTISSVGYSSAIGGAVLVPSDEYTYSWSVDGNTVTGTVTDAGTYTITLSAVESSGYYGDKIATYTVKTAAMEVSAENQTGTDYTGEAQTPSAITATTVGSNSVTITYSSTEAGTYGDMPTFTNAGEHTVYYKITADNHADASGSFTFTIAKAAVAVPTANTGLIYTGSELTGVTATTATIASDSSTLLYSLNGNTATNAESYTATATLGDTANYIWDLETDSSDAQSISWSIGTLGVTITANAQTITYGESISYDTTAFTATLASGDSISEITLKPSRSTAGEGTITASDVKIVDGDADVTDNYSITYKDGVLTINQKEIALKWTAPSDLEYDGTEKAPTVEESNVVGEDKTGLSIEVTGGKDNVNVGSFTFTATITNDNYKLPDNSVSPEYTITAKALSASVSTSSGGTAGGTFGSVELPTFTFNNDDDGTILDEDDYTITWTYTDMDGIESDYTGTDFANAGTYTYIVSATSTGNYSTSGQTGTVSVARQTVTVPTAATDLIYDGEVQMGVSSANDDVYTVTAGTATNANSYTATATLSNTNNYEWILDDGNSTDDQKIEWSIAQKTITVSAGNETPTKVYDNSTSTDATLTYTINDVVEEEVVTLTLGTPVYNSANVSEATKITMTYALADSAINAVNANYSLASGTFEYDATITKADYVMDGVTFDDATNTYDGTTQNIAVGGTLPTGLDGIAVTVEYSEGSQDVVTDKKITATFATDSSNYNTPAAVTAKLTIEQKDASVTVSTDKTSITYGDEVPSYTISIADFVASDSIDTSDFTATTGYEVYSDIGNYDFTITNADSTYKNYKITYEDSTDESYTDGDFTVGTYAITVTADSDSKTYDGTALTDGGFANSDLFADFTVEVVMTSTSTITNYADNAGNNNVIDTVAIKYGGGDVTSNFVITKVAGTLAISQKEVEVSDLSAEDKTYDGANTVVVTYSTSGILTADSGVSVSKVASFDDVDAGVQDVSVTYSITGDTNSNYVLADGSTTGSTTATISQKEVSLTWTTLSAEDLVYNNADKVVSATVGDIISGDGTVTVTAYSTTGEIKNVSDEVFYYEATTLSDSNYKLPTAAKSAEYTITAKDATVTVKTNDTEITYGDAVPGHTISIDGFVDSDNIKTTDFTATTTYTSTSNVGDYGYKITVQDELTNYNITYKDSTYASYTDADFEVVEADLVVAVTGSQSVTYTSESQGATAPTADAVNGLDVSVKYADGDDEYTLDTIPAYESAKTYTINYQITADNHNTVTGSITYVINKAEVILTAKDGTMVYGSTPADDYGYDVTSGTIYGSELGTITSQTTETSTSDVGTDYVTTVDYTANDNYDMTLVEGNFEIINATIVYDGAFSDTSVKYNGANQTITVDLDAIITVNREDFTVAYGTSYGTYGDDVVEIMDVEDSETIVYWQVTADNHETITGSNTITISKAELTVSPTTQTITYGDSISQDGYEITGWLGVDATAETKPTVSGSVVLSTDNVNTTTAGEIAINVDDLSSDNYTFKAGDDAILVIEEKAIIVTIVNKTSVYGSEEVELTYTTVDGDVESGDTLVLTLEKATGVNTGYYDITGTDKDSNYAITFANETDAYEITEKPITVTIEDKTSIYGSDFVELTYTTETDAVETGDTLDLTLTKADGIDVGSYDITGADNDSNYAITFVDDAYIITGEVTVDGVKQSGSFANGVTTEIAASASGTDEYNTPTTFDAWVEVDENAVALENVNGYETTLTMGATSVSVEATYKYVTPEIAIDYVNGQLTGFENKTEDGNNYIYEIIVDGETFSSTTYSAGYTAINVNLYGETIQIVKKGVGDIADSDPLEIEISALPTVGVEVTQPTSENIYGSIKVSSDMKYRLKGGSDWTEISSGEAISGIDTQSGDVTYEFMIDAVENSSFASQTTQVVVYEFAYSEITIENGTIEEDSLVDGSSIYQAGTTITIKPNDVDGKTFARWTYSAGSVVDNGNGTYTFAVPSVDVTITAVYEVVSTVGTIAVDYENETIGTFDEGTYLINGVIYEVESAGTSIGIDSSWLGKDVRIYSVLGDEGSYEYSSTYVSVSIAKRAAASTITVTQPTSSEATATISGMTDNMEYSTDGKTWTSGILTTEVGTSGTYQVRTAATSTSPASEITTIKVVAFREATVELIGDVTVDKDANADGTYNVGSYDVTPATVGGQVASYVVVTSSDETEKIYANEGIFTVSITEACKVSVVYAYATPDILVDYETEMLTGFTENAAYTINGKSYTADSNGEIAIDTLWLGTDIAIVKTANGDVLESAVKTVAIDARTSKPVLSATDPSSGNLGTITLPGITTNLQYRLKGETDWNDVENAKFAGIDLSEADVVYEFRYSASNEKESFKSNTTTVTLYHMVTYEITIDDGKTVVTHEKAYGETITVVTPDAETGEVFDYWSTIGLGSLTDEDGDGTYTFTVGASDATITAKFTYQGVITGEVVDNGDNPQANVDVYIYQGDTLIYSVKTNSDGEYEFINLPYGAYQLIAITEIDGKSVELSLTLEVDGSEVAKTITIPMGGITTKVEDNDTTYTTTVEGLESQLSDDDKGGDYQVVITLTKEASEADEQDEELIQNHIESENELVAGLVLDYTYEKSSENIYSGEASTLNQPDEILAIYQYLPEEMWDKQISIIRVHDGESAVLGYGAYSANEYGEYYELKGQYVIIYTKSFSEYIFAYDPTTEIQAEAVAETTTSSSSSGAGLDQSVPEIEADGSVLTITDANLIAVYVNGEKHEADSDTFEIDLAEFGDGEYEIVAWDRYGRTTTQIFTISGEEVESGDVVESETETPAETETPTATQAPTQTEDTSSSNFPWWILIAAVAICGGVGYVIYKKKK